MLCRDLSKPKHFYSLQDYWKMGLSQTSILYVAGDIRLLPLFYPQIFWDYDDDDSPTHTYYEEKTGTLTRRKLTDYNYNYIPLIQQQKWLIMVQWTIIDCLWIPIFSPYCASCTLLCFAHICIITLIIISHLLLLPPPRRLWFVPHTCVCLSAGLCKIDSKRTH